MTSMPWLKMAPNCVGQWRMHVSQLMHSAISMRRGALFHLGLRSRCSMRWSLVAAAMRVRVPPVPPALTVLASGASVRG